MRPSTEITIKRGFSYAFTVVMGLVLMGGGGFFLYLEMTKEATPHTTHVFLYAGVALLGALVIRPDPILAAFKKGATAATPFIPSFGRRDYDNPPPKDGAP